MNVDEESLKKALLTNKKNKGFFISITFHFMSKNNHTCVQIMFHCALYLLHVLYCILCMCYVNTYAYIRQCIYCALDALYIIHLHLIFLQIFSKCHANFFAIFLSFLIFFLDFG